MRTAAARFSGSLVGVAFAFGLTLATLVAQGAPQQPPPPPAQPPAETPEEQQPIFRAGINFVRVDVIVTDKQGNPVTDLEQEDFEVLEDNKAQKVETFRLVEVGGQQVVETTGRIRSRNDEEIAAADDSARIFVFFLDDYHVRLGASMAARADLVQFVQNNIAPRDLLAVMYPLSPLDTVTLTRDHASIIRMLERFEGRKFNYQPRNSAEERYADQPTHVVETIRRQVSLSAVEGLSVKLGALREGRKSIILVSEGYTAMLPPQMRDQNAQLPGFGNPNRNNPFAGENDINEDRAQFGASLDVQREMQDVYNAANRSNTAIYAVDPRGLSTGEFDINENVSIRTSQQALGATQDTLRVLAAETDGRAIVNRNDLAKGMQQIVRDASAYYLIGYNSTQAPSDGKFHAIRVRIKRPGVQVRARKGYWALNATETAAALAPPKAGPPPAINKALASLATPSGRFVRTWIGTSAGEAGKTKVTFVWEALPQQPGVRRETPRDVTLMVASPSGDVVFRGEVGAAPAMANGSGAGPLGGSNSATVSFDAPPGRLEMRMTVRDAERETLDTESREVTVPDLSAAEPRLGTPRVFVARNAREFQQLSQDTSAIPTAGRDFRRTDRLLVRVDAFGPGDGGTVTSRLLNRAGQRMLDVSVTRGEGAMRQMELPLASLAPGEYLLEVATSTEGQPPITELVAFKVGT